MWRLRRLDARALRNAMDEELWAAHVAKQLWYKLQVAQPLERLVLFSNPTIVQVTTTGYYCP
jgi:hypothetical protein